MLDIAVGSMIYSGGSDAVVLSSDAPCHDVLIPKPHLLSVSCPCTTPSCMLWSPHGLSSSLMVSSPFMVPLLQCHAFFPPLPWPLALSFMPFELSVERFLLVCRLFTKWFWSIFITGISTRDLPHANFDLSFSWCALILFWAVWCTNLAR